MTTISDPVPTATLGVDTHLDQHVGAVMDDLGRTIATTTVPATQAGYRELLAWTHEHGTLRAAGVEGTGSYGAGLAHFLATQGVAVTEVTRGSRTDRRHVGKNDVVDAQAAARAVLAGTATAAPKDRTGIVESIRVLRLARATAVKARSQTAIQLRALVVSAPDEIRDELIRLKTKTTIVRCAGMRPGPDATR